ncbi:MAG: RnfABCDGE type electron transport complex subunit D [Erysipelotrichaceae bacterium]|nr:RnfABCDGE type electron transport complex subunit D [Erysipelotrichaceae bacterium]MDD3924759.1 RnfABCDGE type electron transport complex subunit D [Erysipelotrichaceae bacterium]MDD4642240.1 RnfABCDGE type electron transport complex subunit D [Erysipelotrichaceae bacterium]
MKFISKPAPNYRDKRSTQDIMMDVTLALVVVALFAIVFNFMQYGSAYGIRVILVILVAVGSSVLTEVVWFLLNKKPVLSSLAVSFPWVTGLILALMCQVNVSLYALSMGSIFAILFGKLIFGGFGHNIFNPAGVGRAVVLTGFASAVVVDFATGATPTSTMNAYGWLINDAALGETFLSGFGGLSNLFIGSYAGALGETSTLTLILVGIYLSWRKAIDWRIPVAYIGTLLLLATVVGLSNQAVVWYPLFHILTGGAVFGAIFMLTDPVTSPTSMTGRIIFAVGAAIITMVIRLKANLPEGVLFSILIMNMLTPIIEGLTDGQQIKRQTKNMRSILVVLLAGVLLTFGLGNMLVAKDPNAKVEPEEPPISLKQLALSDASLDEFVGEIVSKSADGDFTTYNVKVAGYGELYATDDYYTYTDNELAIVVDTVNKKLISITYVTFGDTPKIGDKTKDEEYLATFKDMDLSDLQQDVDLLSGATYTSMSIASAVKIVMMDLGN